MALALLGIKSAVGRYASQRRKQDLAASMLPGIQSKARRSHTPQALVVLDHDKRPGSDDSNPLIRVGAASTSTQVVAG